MSLVLSSMSSRSSGIFRFPVALRGPKGGMPWTSSAWLQNSASESRLLWQCGCGHSDKGGSCARCFFMCLCRSKALSNCVKRSGNGALMSPRHSRQCAATTTTLPRRISPQKFVSSGKCSSLICCSHCWLEGHHPSCSKQ